MSQSSACSKSSKINTGSDMDKIDVCSKMDKNDVCSELNKIDARLELDKIDVCSGCRRTSTFLQVLPCKHTICQDCVFNSVYFKVAGEDKNCTVCGVDTSTTNLPALSKPQTHEIECLEQNDSPTIEYSSIISYLSEVQFAHPGCTFSSRLATKSIPIPANKRHRTRASVFTSCANGDYRMNVTDERVVEGRSQDKMFTKGRRILERFRGETNEMDDRYHFRPIQPSKSDDDDDNDDDDDDDCDDDDVTATAKVFSDDFIKSGVGSLSDSQQICI